jgi:hypothetical protein
MNTDKRGCAVNNRCLPGDASNQFKEPLINSWIRSLRTESSASALQIFASPAHALVFNRRGRLESGKSVHNLLYPELIRGSLLLLAMTARTTIYLSALIRVHLRMIFIF